MIATHPTTGKPIRILRSEATLSKNATTAVWIQPSFAPSHRWSRWNTIVSDINSLPVLQGQIPSILILRTPEEVDAWRPWFATHTDCELVILCNEPLDLPFVCLEISKLNSLYPFLHMSITNTSSMEDLVSALCHLLRFHTLVTSQKVLPWTHGTVTTVPIDATDAVIPHTWWISQFYEPAHPSRARELRECLNRNTLCPYIDHILLLTEQEVTLPTSEKIIVHPFGKRATYADTFQLALDRIPKGQGAILLFSNSDIWFDSTLRNLWSINLQDRVCLSLLRWESETTIFGPRPDSQDTWILGRDTFSLDQTPFQFQYGVPGCDNIVSFELMKQKYLIVNPAYTIKTYHNHASSIRSYHARDDILYNPIYLYIHPTAIQSFATTTSFGPSLPGWNSSRNTFSRSVHPIRDTTLSLGSYTPASPSSLYHLTKELFVTPTGLISDYHTLWVNDFLKTQWATSTLDILVPTRSVPSLIALPGVNTSDPAHWMLHAFPQVLRIQTLDPTARCLIPSILASLLPTEVICESDVQYVASSVWTVPSQQQPPTQEDITLLRSYFKQDVSSSPFPTIVFFVNDQLLTLHHAEQIYKIHCVHTIDCETVTSWNVHYLHPTDSISTVLHVLQKADWVVGETNHPFFPWIWNLKPNSTVLEFQSEQSLSEEIIHLAGAASLKYILGVQRFREPIEDRRQQALVDVGIAIKKYGMVLRLKELGSTRSLPIITLPTGMTGIHMHSGDSFRAMIQLWKERGYCKIESAVTPFCWWGGVGETLLYDRDTMKWMDHESPSYKLVLIGNPSTTNNLRQSKWSYWPRHPHLVESVHPLSWKERTIASLFLGRIENGVQKKYRETADWKSAVELFECPIDSTGGPYKYSPSEYLDQLCKAKFGLCLAGFGQKCHREIEYYACGTVPIASPECDMTGYLHPPVEGVHYFRASTPENVRHIVETTSRETWERMSLAGHTWWRDNASAEGLFRLTSTRIRECLPYAGIGLPK